MEKMKALVMQFGDPSGDPRPRRMIDLLQKQGFLVDVVSHAPKTRLSVNEHLVIRHSSSVSSKIFHRLIHYARKVISVVIPCGLFKDRINSLAFGIAGFQKTLNRNIYQLIVVEDLYMLPLALQIKCEGNLIFDAREYYPRQNEESFWWRMFERPERIRLCETYLKQCDYMLTVSPGLAAEYEKDFGVKAVVYRSVPFFIDGAIRPTDLNSIRLVHHGVSNPNRQLEKMIDVVRQLDSRFSLDMYLTGSKARIDYLKAYAKTVPAVRFCEPVPFDDINSVLSTYDIGIFYNKPLTFNLRHSLPNKLFEFIQARLAVAIGPSPDMADIVRTYRCGVVADAFSVAEMANKLNALTSEAIDDMKQNADIAARELNFEAESMKFLKILESIGV